MFMKRIIRKILHRIFTLRGIIVNNCSIGENVHIQRGAKIIDSTVGQGTYIGPEVRLFGADVGPYVSIGPRVTAGENEHEQKLFTTSDILLECIERKDYQAQKKLRTEIGADAWVGANAFVRKGVKIGVGAIVGAHAVVLNDLPAYAIAVGVPARIIGYRFSPETCKRLEESSWWNLEKEQLQTAILARYGVGESATMQSEEEILIFIEEISTRLEN